MIRKLLPVLMALIGTGAGVGAGLFFAPVPTEDAATDAQAPQAQGEEAAPAAPGSEAVTRDFVRLNNQFVVPIVEDGRIGAMVVLSLSIEVTAGNAQTVYALEPKLRDGFLQVLFDHANRGGFDGAFTNANSMDVLRRMLAQVAHDLLGPVAHGVLITEIARQDT
ncbi:flagellar FliL protein [Roseovarius sp. MBR-78]|jgi:hypothetical protein|uniref:flagellar basal body-associated protein FliL n=1 Tax=Roseovarius sp. MBR-78 TaxID=3156460 RepID=UPI003392A535